MRFATFNVLSGRSPTDGRVDLDRFAAAIATLDADVLMLQEVDRDQARSGGADLTAIAGEAMGAVVAEFAPALFGAPGGRWQRARAGEVRAGEPAYGCSLLSRLPVRDRRVFRMPAAPVAVPLWVPGHGAVVAREEPRVAVSARLDVGRGITVVGTHLPFVPGWNRVQLSRLAHAVAEFGDPLLLLGDLNLRGRTPARVTGWTALVDAPTFPVERPRWQLDHALLRGSLDGVGTVTSTGVVRLPVSDHRALVVDLEPAQG